MKNVRKVTMWIVCLFVCVTAFAEPNAGLEVEDILVINSFTGSTPWSNSLINPIVNMASRDERIGVVTEHMNMLMLEDEAGLEEFTKNVFRDFSDRTPKMAVLIGEGSFILCEDLDRRWPGIPMILCGKRDYTGPREKILRKQALAPDERIPLHSLRERYNLTMLPIRIYMEESLNLMKRLIPGMKRVLYIGDETYICQQNDYDLSELVHSRHPELSYRFLSTRDLDTDSLFSVLNRVDVNTTGILFSSWFQKKMLKDNSLLFTNSHRVIASSPVPLFSFENIGIEEEGGIVGGFIYDKKNYTEYLLQTIQEVADGRPAREIPFYNVYDGRPVFDYHSLLSRGLDPGLCPRGTLFYNQPPSFWERNKYTLAGISGLVVLLLLSFQYQRLRVLEKIKRAQQRELAVNTRFQELINNMPILYMYEELILDKNGRVVETKFRDVNHFFEQKFMTKEQVDGKAGSELFPDSMPEFLHFMNIALHERRSVTFSYYYKDIDTFYNVVLNVSRDGRYVDVFCLDVTELHHVQEQLSATNSKLAMALEVANIVPWKWDLKKQTILCDVNRPIELSCLEHEVKEDQLSVPESRYFSKIHREDLEKVKQAYRDLIEGRTNKVKEEYRVVNKVKGHYQTDWVEAQAAVESRDEKGEPLTLVGSSLVITERKRVEAELMSAKERAEESNRLKSAFLANMSHEIRTPLNAIVGFSGILAATEEEQEKKEYISIIENNNDLLLQLISDILDLSKIEAGTMEFVYSDFELNGVMRELENSLRLRLDPNKPVTLHFEPGLPECFVHLERNRLSQLVINLVTNAIKFTNKGSIRFGYDVREDKKLFFYVADTGCGIPQEQQASVFGRFVKLNSFAQGTGLGLSICQTLVQHMNGEIGVESVPGKGSTFWFILPFEDPKGCLMPAEKIEPIRLEKRTLTILVAEDNDSNYKLIESILRKDYHLLHAWNGREAVEMYRQFEPQLVLMDINMPVMDGYEATREIRKLSTRVPIIAVTAFAYASDEQKVMDHGFDAYMSKPINAGQLRTKISSILQRHIVFM